MIEKIKLWIAANKTLALIAGAIIVMLVLPKLFRRNPRRRKRKTVKPVRIRVRRKSVTGKTTGRKKPAWMVKGSPEAKRHMAKLRRLKS